MRNLIFILLMYVFSSCNDCNYKITELVKARVKFIDLPQRVQNFYQNSSEFGQDNPSLIKFACLDTDSNFTLETIETWYGPWVDYYELIDQAKQLSYRIDQGTPIPFVVYENKLYLVDKFNMFTNLKEYSSLEFSRYDLR
jgi:hypothetical protein